MALHVTFIRQVWAYGAFPLAVLAPLRHKPCMHPTSPPPHPHHPQCSGGPSTASAPPAAYLPRRAFLQAGVVASTAPLLGCGPALRDVRFTHLPAALAEMQRLAQAPTLQSTTLWGWAKTLAHLAQSIEYSMTGFPTQKSAAFQTLLGKPAFEVFAWRGHMRHDLAQPIPGSPALPDHPPLQAATLRLLHASQQFLQWQGPLQPHFAYGVLTHAEYEQAHAMHLANHFAAFEAAAA